MSKQNLSISFDDAHNNDDMQFGNILDDGELLDLMILRGTVSTGLLINKYSEGSIFYFKPDADGIRILKQLDNLRFSGSEQYKFVQKLKDDKILIKIPKNHPEYERICYYVLKDADIILDVKPGFYRNNVEKKAGSFLKLLDFEIKKF